MDRKRQSKIVKALHTLIRLHRFRVEEKQREIGGMIANINDIERQVRELEKQFSEEKVIAQAAPENAGILFGNFVAHCILKQKQFAVAILEIEEKLAIAREEIREEYKDLKGFELTQETRDRWEALEQAKVEQAVLDEIGIEAYRRARTQ